MRPGKDLVIYLLLSALFAAPHTEPYNRAKKQLSARNNSPAISLEKSHPEAKIDSLEAELVHYQKIDFITTVPASISLEEFRRVLEAEPEAEPLLEAILAACEKNASVYPVHPALALAIAKNETHFKKRVRDRISWCGAAGYWQIMPETGEYLGLKVYANDDYLKGKQLWQEYRKFSRLAQDESEKAKKSYRKISKKSRHYRQSHYNFSHLEKWLAHEQKAEEARKGSIRHYSMYADTLAARAERMSEEELAGFDQRLILPQSTDAAVKYMAMLLKRNDGDIRLMFFSYNGGPTDELKMIRESLNFQNRCFRDFISYCKAIYGKEQWGLFLGNRNK